MSFLSPLYALDLGSKMIRIYSADSQNLVVLSSLPAKIRRGRVTDERLASSFLFDALSSQFHRPFAIAKPRMAAVVPTCVSQVEKLALYQTLVLSGASSVQLVSTAVAAACGAGVDLTSNRAVILLSCGQALSELAIVLCGTQTFSQELFLTMEDLSVQVAKELNHELKISFQPESLAKLLITVSPLIEEGKKDHHLPGKNMINGKLGDYLVPQAIISRIVRNYITAQAERIELALHHLPATLATDVVEQGMIIYGGLAAMKGLPRFLSDKLSIPVSTVPDPELVVINGLKEMVPSIYFDELDEDPMTVKVLGC